MTLLVSVISLAEILLVGQRLYTQNFLVFETMLAVAFYYVLIVTVFDKLLAGLEGYMNILRRKPRPLTLDRRTRAALRAEDSRAQAGLGVQGAEYALQVQGARKCLGGHEALKVVETLAREGMTMLIVTHEMSFAFSVSDRVLFMDSGRVLLDAPPARLLASQDPRVKRFLSHVQMAAGPPVGQAHAHAGAFS